MDELIEYLNNRFPGRKFYKRNNKERRASCGPKICGKKEIRRRKK